mgnify:CR=1 FL=1
MISARRERRHPRPTRTWLRDAKTEAEDAWSAQRVDARSDSRRALADVVEEGTATKAQLGPIQVAGKTGTAQVFKKSVGVDADKQPKDERDHAWFIGYAPADKPEIAFAIVIEHGGHGGTTAAPVVRRTCSRCSSRTGFRARKRPSRPPALQARLSAPSRDRAVLATPAPR